MAYLCIFFQEVCAAHLNIIVFCFQIDSGPCGNFSQTLPYITTAMSWLYVTVTYIQPSDYYGYDYIKLYVKDDKNATSDVITLQIAVMESPCQNKGQCQG